MTRRRLPWFALLAANAISMTGNVVALVAIPWFVLESTGSAAKAGLAGFFTTLPAVIASFVGGALVDRIGARRMSIVADVASAAAVAAIPALELSVGIELWQLLALVFVGALLDAPGATARWAMLPDVAELAGWSIERASSVAHAVQRGSLLFGAPLGGLLVAALGATGALWVDAASFAVSAALIGALVPALVRASSAPGVGRFVTELVEGVRFIWRDRLLRALTVTVLVTNFLEAPTFPVLMPVFAREALGGSVALGAVIGTFGGFALLGSVAFAAVGHRLPRRRTFLLAFVLASLPYVVLATLPSLAVVLVTVALWGLAAGPINPILSSIEFERVPAELRGRVIGASTAGAFAAIPAGVLIGGLVVEALGVATTLLAIGACYVALTSYGLFNPALRDMERPAPVGR